ncbi:MAG TPA: hypothetical protein VHM70_18110 [Polyangiaceae bacterium]|nr:hypothetical protein [Polyangiaceae bacterium]
MLWRTSFRPHPKIPVSALVILIATLPIACSADDGSDGAGTLLTLSSPSIQAGQALPAEFTCSGKAFGDGTSPALDWSNEPKGTQSYAILLEDMTIEAGQSAGDTNPEHPFHWTIWNIPAATHSLPASLPTTQSPLTGA